MENISTKAKEILKVLYLQINDKSTSFHVTVNINTMAETFKITKENFYLCLVYLMKKELITNKNLPQFGDYGCETDFSIGISITGIDLIENNI